MLWSSSRRACKTRWLTFFPARPSPSRWSTAASERVFTSTFIRPAQRGHLVKLRILRQHCTGRKNKCVRVEPDLILHAKQPLHVSVICKYKNQQCTCIPEPGLGKCVRLQAPLWHHNRSISPAQDEGHSPSWIDKHFVTTNLPGREKQLNLTFNYSNRARSGAGSIHLRGISSDRQARVHGQTATTNRDARRKIHFVPSLRISLPFPSISP